MRYLQLEVVSYNQLLLSIERKKHRRLTREPMRILIQIRKTKLN